MDAETLTMKIAQLNMLAEDTLRTELLKCCGSGRWVNEMLKRRPFTDEKDLLEKSDGCWSLTLEADWLEAFSHHPKIGDLENLQKKFAATVHLAGSEQSAVSSASASTLQALADENTAYENKFGFIFIVCATGKSADEMLAMLRSRIHNDRNSELVIAAAEQHKITALRLKKLIA